MILTLTPLDAGFSGSNLPYGNYPFAVGFSLRKVRRDYAGPCITVRRSSDSTEQDIGFRSDGLIDTAALLSFCGAGSGFIRRWYDQSTTANHAVQTTASLQPRIVNSGSLEVNEFGKPAIRFIDSVPATLGWHLTFENWHTASQAYVGHFSCYSLLSNGGFPNILGTDPLDRGIVSLHNGTTRQSRALTVRIGGTTAFNGTAFDLNRTYARHGSANRTIITTYLDKTEAAVASTADRNEDFVMPTRYWLGGANALGTIVCDLEMHEFLFYTTDQTSNNLAIRSDMFDYWRS